MDARGHEKALHLHCIVQPFIHFGSVVTAHHVHHHCSLNLEAILNSSQFLKREYVHPFLSSRICLYIIFKCQMVVLEVYCFMKKGFEVNVKCIYIYTYIYSYLWPSRVKEEKDEKKCCFRGRVSYCILIQDYKGTRIVHLVNRIHLIYLLTSRFRLWYR